MNTVSITGRLTRKPECRYAAQTQNAVLTMTVAVDRPVRAGEEKKTDFPRVIVFGKTAENCERYLDKGSMVGVTGRIQTGSYENRDGAKIFTTEIIAERVEFLSTPNREQNEKQKDEGIQETMYDGFEMLNEEVPF